MRVAIRADSSALMGTGHLVRCLTLANELRRHGASVVFVSREHEGHILARVTEEGHVVHRLPAPAGVVAPHEDYGAWLGVTQQRDAEETLRRLAGRQYDWVVVDHYGLDKEWERRVRGAATRILVIDDLANRRHECEVLLDQNYFGAQTQSRYQGLTPDGCKLLLGPTFALLRPEYAQLRALLPARHGVVRRVVVFFGGSDRRNDTRRVLEAMSCDELSGLAVDVVIGAGHGDRTGIAAWAAQRAGAAVHSGLPSLAGLFARADLAIGGGGSTTWERACLGVPSIVATIADNQTPYSRLLADGGYHIMLGDSATLSVSDWRDALIAAVKKPDDLARLSSRAAALTDGDGVRRLLGAMRGGPAATKPDEAPTGHPAAVQLRITVLSDADSWLNESISGWLADWRRSGHRVRWIHEPASLEPGDVCFLIGCSQLVAPQTLSQSSHTLVVHESDLPQGRGWSPMTWQVLEDRRRIVVTLFEAAEKVDAGRLHLQTTIELTGRELSAEWRRLQARATEELCKQWVATYPQAANGAREQRGEASYYPRRRPSDSRLDPERSIADQFDLLRVVDNARYPAHFDYRGRRYRLLVEADDAASADEPAGEPPGGRE